MPLSAKEMGNRGEWLFKTQHRSLAPPRNKTKCAYQERERNEKKRKAFNAQIN